MRCVILVENFRYKGTSCEKFFDILYRTEISAIFAYFCPNLVVVATALSSLKIQIAHFNSPIPKGCYSRTNFLDILYRTEISTNLAYFCPNLVAMATALAPVKIQIAYLKSPTPKTVPYMQKVSRYVVQS